MATYSTGVEIKIGDKVYFGRTHGERTFAEVVKINPKKLKLKQLEARGVHAVGTLWTVPPSLCTPAPSGARPGAAPPPVAPVAPKPKRPDTEILKEIGYLYGSLSPENLSCDGELSRSATARRGAGLNRRLKECFVEIGRHVTESEASDAVLASRGGYPGTIGGF
jgi:hypothetical protein